MHWTEQKIREHLDGTFTKVMPDGGFKTVSVEPDHKPDNINRGGRPLGTKVIKYAPWTPADQTILVELRKLGWPFGDIAWKLDRSEDSCKKHFHVLRARGVV